MPTNAEIAGILRQMSLLLEAEGVVFKPQAYQKAAYAIESQEKPLEEIFQEGGEKALRSIPGIGEGIARRIAEFLHTGHIEELETLRKRAPIDLVHLTAVDGVGAKMARTLYEALGIRTLEELEEAARKGQIQKLPGFGPKREQRILRGIALLRESSGRRPLGEVLPLAHQIEERLRKAKGVRAVAVVGSIRRYKETIGDMDFLVATLEPEEVMRVFATLPGVEAVLAKGPTKTLVRFPGIDADLRAVPPQSFGAALCYFTGSKAHNLALRKLAIEKGYKLNEYGLFRGERVLAGRTEEEIYEALGLPFIPPELREDQGEIQAALKGKLPVLIEPGDLKGDLQVQTSWTDGADSIEAMAEAARKLGFEYLAITDHTRDLAMVRGSDEEKLLAQKAEIARLNEAGSGIRILSGAEVNIRRDGSLDISEDVLAKLDVVGAAIHSHFDLPREEMTRRVLRAMENPHVDILFHPTARALGRRPPIDLDMDEIFSAAKRTGTTLEIDAHPGRLDLKDEQIRRAISAGVKLVIDSDAHSQGELRFSKAYGVPLARRGWAKRSDVLNTLPVKEFLKSLKGA